MTCRMKRGIPVLLIFLVLVMFVIVVVAFLPSDPRSDVSVRFVTYTNDVHNFRSRFYRVSDNSQQSMLIFEATNRSGRRCVFWPGIELKQAGT